MLVERDLRIDVSKKTVNAALSVLAMSSCSPVVRVALACTW